MAEPLSTPKGIHDILPDDHDYHTFIKKVVRHRARQAGFRRITTPVLEYTELFARGVGEGTDIVSKEMYTFEDRKERSLTLKPEGTAGVARAYIEHGMNQLPKPVLLYYIEPHFRYDRPQKGRYRQFWQFGFEILGESDAALDAQAIHLAYKIFSDLGIADVFELQLNTIGTPEARKKYIEVLKDFIWTRCERFRRNSTIWWRLIPYDFWIRRMKICRFWQRWRLLCVSIWMKSLWRFTTS